MRLEFKWTVSRGRNTYGYNVCSLYVDGTKVSSCNGGGYDMKATALGNWFARRFEGQLRKMVIPMSRRNGVQVQEYYGLTYHDPNFDPGKAPITEDTCFGAKKGMTVEEAENAGVSLGLDRYQAFYLASSRVPTERHTVPLIDGACGLSSVERIMEATGLKLENTYDWKGRSVYRLTGEG
jgi:hypothetical protein